MENSLQCSICRKKFTQKSSLVRHQKRCTPGPAPSLRQKSCRQCTNSKTKCDLQRPRCSRCEQRDTSCEYIVPLTRGTRVVAPMVSDVDMFSGCGDGDGVHGVSLPFSGTSNLDLTYAPAPPLDLINTSHDLAYYTDLGDLTFAQPNQDPFLVPDLDHLPSGSDDAGTPDDSTFGTSTSDWLLWGGGPLPSTPPLVKHSMETLLRVMKTWPRTLAKGVQAPIMLHWTATDPAIILPPLANCVTICQMWASQPEGSSEIVRRTVIREIQAIFEQYRTMSEPYLLSALQSLVFYILLLLFPASHHQDSVSLVDPALFLSLRHFVAYIAQTGLMLQEEHDHVRPSWDAWIHITSKRRAVFSLYLIHWSYTVYHGQQQTQGVANQQQHHLGPCWGFPCRALGLSPAPAPKYLWQERDLGVWEQGYLRWLGQWGEAPYRMREFAGIRQGPGLDRRTEIWLEDADELGVLFFSVGTTVHPVVEWW